MRLLIREKILIQKTKGKRRRTANQKYLARSQKKYYVRNVSWTSKMSVERHQIRSHQIRRTDQIRSDQTVEKRTTSQKRESQKVTEYIYSSAAKI